MRAAVVVSTALVSALMLAACDEPGRHARTPATRATAGTSAPASTAPAAVAVIETTPAPKPAPPNPCATNRAAKAVLVSVPRQHAWFCAKARLVYRTAVTTGAVDRPYDATPTGSFRIQAKQRNQVLTLLSGRQYTVRYWIPFDAPLFGFHDSPWQKLPYGSQQYRTRGSHGCIHAPLAAMRFLYSWADVGTAVRIRR